LYQFVDRTWLDTMDRHGAAHGYPNIAGAITRDAHGNPVVRSESAEQYILSLRENPRISALMAAELAQDNKQALEGSLGREVGNAELYMAHFLGAGGAAKFLGEMEVNGAAAANSVMPAAARSNVSVFYEHGRALTLDQVFARFEGRFGEAPAQDSEPARAAIIAAADPALAALRELQPAPEPGAQPSLRADLAQQMFTLSLLQASNQPDDDQPNEWRA
jgi:hypothetical protein